MSSVFLSTFDHEIVNIFFCYYFDILLVYAYSNLSEVAILSYCKTEFNLVKTVVRRVFSKFCDLTVESNGCNVK